MSKGHKKSGDKDKALQTIIFITAVLNLVDVLTEIIKKLIE